MTTAFVQICSDPRLNHEVIREQIRSKLERIGLNADRIFILNEPGGNVGSSFTNSLDLAVRRRELVVFTAILHHNDCLAAEAGLRAPLETSLRQLGSLLVRHRIGCPVLSGMVGTENSDVVWADEPRLTNEVFPFRMPRMFGR